MTMRPLSEFPADARRAVRFMLCDIDDTITDHGRLPAASLAAMERLQAADIRVLPITGRPAGWCDHIARMWPVDAVVGENGAFYFRYDRDQRRMIRRFDQPDAVRAENRKKLESLKDRILDGVPGSAIASDQPYRETDLAIDFCEDVPRLPKADVDRIVALFEDAGATAKISSILRTARGLDFRSGTRAQLASASFTIASTSGANFTRADLLLGVTCVTTPS